jgi:hypothetical protein
MDLGESMPDVRNLAASNDHVFWLKETGELSRDDKSIADDVRCVAADAAGAFAATPSGVMNLDDDRSVVIAHATPARCVLLLSASDVWLATWNGAASSIERAPRAGGAFVRVRDEPNVAGWWYASSAMLVWTSVEHYGKDRDGYERTAVLTHVARGAGSRVVARGDTEWVGVTSDTLYLREPDGLRAVTLR